jgi:hypothetical protein
VALFVGAYWPLNDRTITIKQTSKTPAVNVGQIYSGVIFAPTSAGGGWQICLAGDVIAIVPRPYGCQGPVQGDAVMVRVLGIKAETGAIVGTLVQGKTITSIR